MGLFYIILALTIFILSYPYVRCFFKRLIALIKIKSICRKKKYKLYLNHIFSFLGNKYAKNCDFYIETNKELFSIKLFGVSRRPTILIFKDNGEYFVRNFILTIFYGQGIFMHFNGRPKKIRTYNFRYKYNKKWDAKDVRQILLISPVSMDIRFRARNGREDIVGAGNVVNGMEIYSLPQFLGELEKAL